jgi:aryl-alcohol dehydrogenase-like predicted oxidoreductase
MRYRQHPRTGWELSEVGYGMWGLGGWTGSDDAQTLQSLAEAVALGCNFFDTAWAYGAGHSERLLAQTLRAHRDRRLYVATKVPPKNERWIQIDDCALDAVFPSDHIRQYTEASLENLGVDTIDLQQFHAWSDRWASDDRWQRTIDDLRREGLVRSWGISVNRWETTNVLRALETGLIDCVQVVYNIFDQDPEDVLLPYCQDRGIAVIARVPFDEGSLTGALTRDTRFPDGDWRNMYFTPSQLDATLPRDEHIWDEEVVEVFLDADGSGRNYAELEINPINVVCDLRVETPWPSLKSLTEWDWEGMTTAVVPLKDTHGTVEGWTALGRLPWTGLRSLYPAPTVALPPQSGQSWRFNVFRIKRPGGPAKPQEGVVLAAWSKPSGPSFHDPAAFQTMRFR